MVAELDSPEFEEGITFDQFINAISYKMGDKESREGIHRIFQLFDHDQTVK